MAHSLERWTHGIVARLFHQTALEELAQNARIPVINALTDRYHPCQAFADFFTLEEHFGGLRGLKVAYVGDGNNVCHSLLSIGARLGANIRVASPAGYEPDTSGVVATPGARPATRVAKSRPSNPRAKLLRARK